MSQEILAWSSVRLYQNGDNYFRDLLNDLRRAQRYISMEFYIFEIDPLSLLILEELGRARQRGCKVYLLVDGFGSYFWLGALEKLALKHRLNLRVFQPLPRSLRLLRQVFFSYIFRFVRLLQRLNHRDHRKIVIIDKEIAYLGSLNMTQIHSQERMGKRAWKDTGLRLTGGSLPDLSRGFWVSWKRAPKLTLRSLLKSRRRQRDSKYDPKTSLVRLNSTTWSRFWLYRDLLRRVRKAQKRIWIETAYFLPRRSILRALQKAARRGVDVGIIVPSTTDVRIIKWAADGLIKTLTENGVRVYEFQPHILHSKFFLIDDWATVGSHNWNHRSFLHDLEVEAILTEGPLVQQLANDWKEDCFHSRPLRSEDLRPKNPIRAWVGRLAFRLRYLL